MDAAVGIPADFQRLRLRRVLHDALVEVGCRLVLITYIACITEYDSRCARVVSERGFVFGIAVANNDV